MTASPVPDRDLGTGSEPTVRRLADMHLRGTAGPLPARLYWPAPTIPGAPPALLVLVQDGAPASGDVDREDLLSRGLCAQAGVVVLSLPGRTSPGPFHPAAFHDATTVLEWAADHAAELDTDPGRLLVAGAGAGGSLAAALAIHARDHRWPRLSRQVLILPILDARPGAPLSMPSLAGVAPATVVTGGTGDDGRRYAARLRQAGVEVEELHDDDLADGWDRPSQGRRIVAGPMTFRWQRRLNSDYR